ncbi:MAG: hypothetical protein ACLSHU_08125 [Oscillospiraceae bacterium]
MPAYAAGAAPYLLRHRANGCLYQSGNLDDLTRQTLFLLTHSGRAAPNGRRRLRHHDSAVEPEAAAEWLLTLCRCILAGNPHPSSIPTVPAARLPFCRTGGSHERREACGQRRLDHRRKNSPGSFALGGKHDRRQAPGARRLWRNPITPPP